MDAPRRVDHPVLTIAGALMAGGGGTRLGGVPKGLLRREGRTLAERTLEALRAVTSEQFVVANSRDYDTLGLPVHADLRPGCGPLGGLETALARARADHVLVVACDMPALEPGVLHLLAGADPSADVVLPVVGGRPEPLCARYSQPCLVAVCAALDAGERRMIAFHGAVRVLHLDEAILRTVDPLLSTFENANTPEDLARLGVTLP